MQPDTFSAAVDSIRNKGSRFEKSAYYFIRQALDHTLAAKSKNNRGEKSRHVSGPELLEGIRVYALEQYGPMTLTVLRHWNVHRCQDFGEIVFQLIDHGVFGKTEQDKPDDFEDLYHFEDAFLKPFLPENRKRVLQKKRGPRKNEEDVIEHH